MPTLNLLLLHIYLLLLLTSIWEWLYILNYQLPSTSSLCMYVPCLHTYTPLQDRNLSDSWANVGRFVYLSKYPYLLAVGCWQNAIKLIIILARLHIYFYLYYYSYILYIYFFFLLLLTFLNFLHVHSIESQPVDVKLMWTLLSKNDLLLIYIHCHNLL